MGRENSDEEYVLTLCDKILPGGEGSRQHRFEWLLGDPNAAGVRRRLPVDAYWEQHELVVEYREKQHYEEVEHFDKPNIMTISGVSRGGQRKIYDLRRELKILKNGLRLAIIKYSDLAIDREGKLGREAESDEATIRIILEEALTHHP